MLMLIVYTIVFGLCWWLGLYLLSRDLRKPPLLRAGLGLLAYALALALAALALVAPSRLLTQFYSGLIFLPALCWAGALVPLLPLSEQLQARVERLWLYTLMPLSLAVLTLAVGSGAVVVNPAGGPPQGWPLMALAALVGLPLAGELGLALWAWRTARPKGAFGLAACATIFFGLSLGLMLFPLNLLPRPLALPAIGVDLGLLGLAIALLDAFDEGETLRPHMARSLLAAGMSAAAFGSLVALAIIGGAGTAPAMVGLLLAVVALAVSAQTLADPLQGLIDRLAFPQARALQQARANLRESASALPKVDLGLPLAEIEAAEFARLTRRSLSHLGDLGRLVSSPLTQLPTIKARLAARGAPDHPLERAAELKSLLAESIARLKPREGGDFGTTEAWRYYNALYFPYVAGLRPYSRRSAPAELDPAAQKALDWFAAQVPERTLHNWQNAAAKIVADDLRARGIEH